MQGNGWWQHLGFRKLCCRVTQSCVALKRRLDRCWAAAPSTRAGAGLCLKASLLQHHRVFGMMSKQFTWSSYRSVQI